MRNAPEPKEVAKVILESIEASVVSNNNFSRYPVGKDAKLYADAKRKMSDSELNTFVAKGYYESMQKTKISFSYYCVWCLK
jgi:hypothetical protein